MNSRALNKGTRYTIMTLGILLLRIAVGLTIAAHGAQKLFGWFGGPGVDGTAQFMTMLGLRPARRQAVVAGVTEFAGGLLFALGFATPVAAASIASVMLVATATVHWTKGFFLANGGYEFNLVLAVAALAVAFTGPGTASIDALLG